MIEHQFTITVYGTDGKARNLIERNVIWNTGDNGIQAAADAIIRNNIVFNAGGSGIYSRNHQSAVVGNLMVHHNTVVNEGKTALRIIAPGGRGFSGPVIVGNNALYGTEAIRASRAGPVSIVGNAGKGRVEGLGTVRPGEWQGGGDPLRSSKLLDSRRRASLRDWRRCHESRCFARYDSLGAAVLLCLSRLLGFCPLG